MRREDWKKMVGIGRILLRPRRFSLNPKNGGRVFYSSSSILWPGVNDPCRPILLDT